MQNFISRVELHSATYDDYENLHMYMQRHGYARTVRADNGTIYKLPTGTYCSNREMFSASEAMEAAAAAARSTGKEFEVISAEWRSASWQGLPVVKLRAV